MKQSPYNMLSSQTTQEHSL